jgi:hypothetical protein
MATDPTSGHPRLIVVASDQAGPYQPVCLDLENRDLLLRTCAVARALCGILFLDSVALDDHYGAVRVDGVLVQAIQVAFARSKRESPAIQLVGGDLAAAADVNARTPQRVLLWLRPEILYPDEVLYTSVIRLRGQLGISPA